MPEQRHLSGVTRGLLKTSSPIGPSITQCNYVPDTRQGIEIRTKGILRKSRQDLIDLRRQLLHRNRLLGVDAKVTEPPLLVRLGAIVQPRYRTFVQYGEGGRGENCTNAWPPIQRGT